MTSDGTSTAPRDGVQSLPGDEVQPDDANSMTLTGVDLAYLEIASPSMMMDPSTLSAAIEMQVDIRGVCLWIGILVLHFPPPPPVLI